MSVPVIGIDFGDGSSVMAITRRGGVDILTNEVSNRATPSLVSFPAKERALGEAALGQQVMNAKNTVGSFKRMLGRKYADEEVQAELAGALHVHRATASGEIGLVVRYDNKEQEFTPEQITGMYFGQLRRTIEKEVHASVKDVVVSVPLWFTQAQRCALQDSIRIGGLNPVRLINDTTAAALTWGLFKNDIAEDAQINVMIVDVGYSQVSAAVVQFHKTGFRVLGSAADHHVGGRNFDKIIVDHFAAEFLDKFKVDCYKNPRALLRMYVAAERCKKVLTGNAQAPFAIESLMNDTDVKGMLTREKFEELATSQLDRVTGPVAAALAAANLSKTDLQIVEVIGNGHRVPAIQKKLQEFLGHELKKTLDAKEAVAKGCALMAAILSPGTKVRDYKIEEVTPYEISLSFAEDGDAADAKDKESVLIKRNGAVPAVKRVRFSRISPFKLTALYTSDNVPKGLSPVLGEWTVNAIAPPTDSISSEVLVKGKLDDNGIFSLLGATLAVTTDVDEPAASPAAPASADSATPSPAPAGDAGEKKRVKREIPLTTDVVRSASLSKAVADKLYDAECAMYASDRVHIETADKKNACEAYALDMKTKVSSGGRLAAYTNADEAAALTKLADQVLEWLGDEGDDAPKEEYQTRLSAMQKIGDPITARYKEFTHTIPDALQELESHLAAKTALLNSPDEKYSHLTDEDRKKGKEALATAQALIGGTRLQLENAPKTAMPPVAVSSIWAARDNVTSAVRDSLSRPKPKPAAPAPAPAPAADATAAAAPPAGDAAAENADSGCTDADCQDKECCSGEDKPAAPTAPMDLD